MKNLKQKDETRRLHDLITFERVKKKEFDQYNEKLEKIEIERALDSKRKLERY